MKGKLISKADHERIFSAISCLSEVKNPLLFAVGDGNHSLATAAECYKQNPTQLNRYALVEIVNIHDSALCFEPIFRVMFGVDPKDVAVSAQNYFSRFNHSAGASSTLTLVSENLESEISCPAFPVEELQNFIEEYIKIHKRASVDYIHGKESLLSISKKNDAVGFVFQGIKKSELFPYIKERGILPRKSFSMGEALDKRFYIECRKIK